MCDAVNRDSFWIKHTRINLIPITPVVPFEIGFCPNGMAILAMVPMAATAILGVAAVATLAVAEWAWGAST